jgi:hypothetical protein
MDLPVVNRLRDERNCFICGQVDVSSPGNEQRLNPRAAPGEVPLQPLPEKHSFVFPLVKPKEQPAPVH